MERPHLSSSSFGGVEETLRRRGNLLQSLALTAAALLFAVWSGRAMALGGREGTLALLVSVALFAVSFLPMLRLEERLGAAYMAVEVPVLLLLVSTLVFRIRDAEALAADPLDSAALFRIACIGLALFLSAISLTAPHVPDPTLKSRPYRLYALYVIVVFIGVPLSVYPAQTAYRGIELAAGWLVIAAARRTMGAAAFPRIERTIYWFVVAMAGSVWLGVVLFPDQAVSGTDFAYGASPIPWQLSGVFPALSANGVGDIGATLFLWSMAYRFRPERTIGPSPRVALLLAVVGLITLVGAQYRTGYVGAAIGFTVLIVFRKRGAFALLSVVAVLVAGIWGSSLVRTAEPYVLRGQAPEEAATLSGRFDWWDQAVDVWSSSPIVGRGLLTATRYEVLEPLGRGDVSTIHSTWIEALVGTGVAGVLLLATAFLFLLRRAAAEALQRWGTGLPLLLLVFMFVRSITGTTFETFGVQAVLFAWLAAAMPDIPQWRGHLPGAAPSLTEERL